MYVGTVKRGPRRGASGTDVLLECRGKTGTIVGCFTGNDGSCSGREVRVCARRGALILSG